MYSYVSYKELNEMNKKYVFWDELNSLKMNICYILWMGEVRIDFNNINSVVFLEYIGKLYFIVD